jgi:hypothetical protein
MTRLAVITARIAIAAVCDSAMVTASIARRILTCETIP